MVESGSCPSFEGPVTLKSLLELMWELEKNKGNLKDNVSKKLEEDIRNSGMLNDISYTNQFKRYFDDAVQGCAELYRKLVFQGSSTYSLETFCNHETCLSTYLINNIFDLYACLFYLAFMCDGKASSLGGGNWMHHKLNEKNTEINKWLTDQQGTNDKMLRRGFSGDTLTNSSGSLLFSDYYAKQLTNLTSMYGKLQLCLYGMFFLGKWSNGKTGYALSFLNAFCTQIQGGILKPDQGNHWQLIDPCTKVTRSLDTVQSYIKNICQSYMMSYDGFLNSDKFKDYADWFKKHVHDIITSFVDGMSRDCDYWNKRNLKSSVSHGPFVYGCIFMNDTWNKNDMIDFSWRNNLKDAIKKANTLLAELQYSLPKDRSHHVDEESLRDDASMQGPQSASYDSDSSYASYSYAQGTSQAHSTEDVQPPATVEMQPNISSKTEGTADKSQSFQENASITTNTRGEDGRVEYNQMGEEDPGKGNSVERRRSSEEIEEQEEEQDGIGTKGPTSTSPSEEDVREEIKAKEESDAGPVTKNNVGDEKVPSQVEQASQSSEQQRDQGTDEEVAQPEGSSRQPKNRRRRGAKGKENDDEEPEEEASEPTNAVTVGGATAGVATAGAAGAGIYYAVSSGTDVVTNILSKILKFL